jgi:hypothetical protein
MRPYLGTSTPTPTPVQAAAAAVIPQIASLAPAVSAWAGAPEPVFVVTPQQGTTVFTIGETARPNFPRPTRHGPTSIELTGSFGGFILK